jgi:hypothetical protein
VCEFFTATTCGEIWFLANHTTSQWCWLLTERHNAQNYNLKEPCKLGGTAKSQVYDKVAPEAGLPPEDLEIKLLKILGGISFFLPSFLAIMLHYHYTQYRTHIHKHTC